MARHSSVCATSVGLPTAQAASGGTVIRPEVDRIQELLRFGRESGASTTRYRCLGAADCQFSLLSAGWKVGLAAPGREAPSTSVTRTGGNDALRFVDSDPQGSFRLPRLSPA